MKKQDIASLIVYVLMLVMALLVGLLVLKPLLSEKAGTLPFNAFLFIILIVVAGLFVNVLFLEIGHALGGLLGGYSVVSMNVVGLCLYKKDGRWRLGFKNYDGLTGETILAPRHRVDAKGQKKEPSPKAYVWLPLFFYLIELIICVAFSSLKEPVALSVTAIIFVTIGSMITLYNFIPLHLDSMTDGYRLTLINKKINVEAYNELMRIENLLREGKDTGEIRVFAEITDFTASINLISVYRHLEKGELDAAMRLIDRMLEDPKKVSTVTARRLLAQKLYIMLVTEDLAIVRAYYDEHIDDDVRRFIANDLSMESLRAYVLIAGLLDDAPGEIAYAESRRDKALKRTMKARRIIEKRLYDEAIAKVKERHPDWSKEEQAEE